MSIQMDKRQTALMDDELSKWLISKKQPGSIFAYLCKGYYFIIYLVSTAQSELITADPNQMSLKILKTYAKAGTLKQVESPPENIADLIYSDTCWKLSNVTAATIAKQIKDREQLLKGGRGKAISQETAAKVWHDAGGRCMYEGCGEDLGHTPLTTKNARIAYLAHIVASDPKGPRGNENSHALSDEAENIMLMCDAHHRLIDRVDVKGHPIEFLQDMRCNHVDFVNSVLKGLSYPKTQIITILADIAQVSTTVTNTELYNRVLERGLRPNTSVKHSIRRNQRDKRSASDFWFHFLLEHGRDIEDFISTVSNRISNDSDDFSEVLSIFPLHLVPILILAGRIVGEARKVQLFQYNRDIKSWKWLAESTENDIEFELLYDEKDTRSYSEAILSLELTADLDVSAIPSELKSKVDSNEISYIRIRPKTQQGVNSIQTQRNLDMFAERCRQALKLLQDETRVNVIHLFGISPASSIFRFGQMLQAGYHANCIIYDRSDRNSLFAPAITITGDQAITTKSSGDDSVSIKLR